MTSSRRPPLAVLATHNEESVLRAAEAMEAMGIATGGGERRVHFAQIRGMGEQVRQRGIK